MVELTKRGNIVRKNLLSDFVDQFLFFGFFAAGVVAIIFLKQIAAPPEVVTGVPVGLMLVYAVVAALSKRFRVREDRVGDNLYYLGFLFTLVSLSYALWKFNGGGSDVDVLISNFGIALATTIAGLVLRVVFNQMREDPVVYEREARRELADAARAVKQQLDDVAIQMGDFKRRVSQQIEEGITDISAKASDALEQNVAKFANVSQEVVEKINTAFGTFNDQSVKMSNVASKTVDALQTLFERIERIEASPDLLAAKFEPVIGRFAEAAEESLKRTRSYNADAKKIRELVDLAAGAAAALKDTVQAANTGVDERLEDLSRNVEATSAAVRRLVQSFEASLPTLSAQAEDAQRAAAALGETLAAEVEANRTFAAGLRQAVATEMEANAAAIAAFRSAVTADAAAVSRAREEMQEALAAARSMTLDLERTLVSLSRTMVEKLNAS